MLLDFVYPFCANYIPRVRLGIKSPSSVTNTSIIFLLHDIHPMRDSFSLGKWWWFYPREHGTESNYGMFSGIIQSKFQKLFSTRCSCFGSGLQSMWGGGGIDGNMRSLGKEDVKVVIKGDGLLEGGSGEKFREGTIWGRASPKFELWEICKDGGTLGTDAGGKVEVHVSC